MTSRQSLSPTRRLQLFERHSGRCHICDMKIQVGQKWEVEHVIALTIGGADDESNMRPAHKACHAVKTKVDVAAGAKCQRVKAKHYGIKKRGGFPAGRQSKFKRRIDGTVVLR